MDYKHELIITVVNRGYSDFVIDASREAGASGGTIVFARGTVNNSSNETFMGISIQPEKDIVLTVVKKEDKKRVMRAICDNSSIEEGHGIVFSIPVTNAVGVREKPKENFLKLVVKDKQK